MTRIRKRWLGKVVRWSNRGHCWLLELPAGLGARRVVRASARGRWLRPGQAVTFTYHQTADGEARAVDLRRYKRPDVPGKGLEE